MDHEAVHAIFAASCYFIPVRSKCSQLPVFKNTACVCSSLCGRQVLHPYNTTGRIIVSCIGTCTFLDSKQEGVVLNRPEIDTLHLNYFGFIVNVI